MSEEIQSYWKVKNVIKNAETNRIEEVVYALHITETDEEYADWIQRFPSNVIHTWTEELTTEEILTWLPNAMGLQKTLIAPLEEQGGIIENENEIIEM